MRKTSPNRTPRPRFFARAGTWDAKTGLLSIEKPLAEGQTLEVIGQRAVPWTWSYDGIVADSVKMLLGKEVGQRGVHFEVDESTGTIRLLRAEDCAPGAQYYVSFTKPADPERPNTTIGVGIGNHSDRDAIRRLHGLPVVSRAQPAAATGQVPEGEPEVEPLSVWTTADPRVLVPVRILRSSPMQLSIAPRANLDQRRYLERGRDFHFDAVTQRLVLVGDSSFDSEKEFCMVWAVVADERTAQFPGSIPAGQAVEVTYNGDRLVEGDGFTVDRDSGRVILEAGTFRHSVKTEKGVATNVASYRITTGSWTLGNVAAGKGER